MPDDGTRNQPGPSTLFDRSSELAVAGGLERLGARWGFLAGWGFVIGRTASCAAMALTSAAYAVPPAWQRPTAVFAVIALAAVSPPARSEGTGTRRRSAQVLGDPAPARATSLVEAVTVLIQTG